MSTKLQADTFLRIASVTIAAYDYLVTLPAELRMYSSIRRPRFGWSIGVVLFILIRYVSVALLAVSNFGWFYRGFSSDLCLRYYLVSPVLKVVQIIIYQVIIGYRTWTISQRSRGMGIFLLAFGLIVAALETFSNFDSRVPIQNHGNCTPGSNASSRPHVPQWVFYLLSSVFDTTTIILSSFFLIKSASGINRMTSTLKMLLYDGLGYVVVLTAVNVMNLILYWNGIEGDTQTSGASFGFMVVWIISQKFLIHVHEAAEVRTQHRAIFGPTGRSVARNIRSRSNKICDDGGGVGIDVQVQVERAVRVDYFPKTHRKSRIVWDRRRSDINNGKAPLTSPDRWEL